MRLEEELEGAEAAHDVLRRIGPVDAERRETPAGLRRSPAPPATRCSPTASASNSLGSTEIGATHARSSRSAKRTDAGVVVHLGAEDVHAAAQEVPAPPVGVEADDVVRENALVQRPPDRFRQHAPVVGLRPGDVHEVRQRRRRGVLANDARRHVQVVVVEEDRRLGLTLELLENDLGEVAVDGAVAVTPGEVEPLIDARSARETPEVVLEEPEHRVGDDVVVPVVGRRVVGDEPQPVRRPVGGGLVQRLAAFLLRHLPILVGDGARDPRHVVVADEAPERGDEPAASAPGNAISARVAVEGDGATVRDDDQLPAAGPYALRYPPGHATRPVRAAAVTRGGAEGPGHATRRARFRARTSAAAFGVRCAGFALARPLSRYTAEPTVASFASPVSFPSSRLNSASQSRRSRGIRKCRPDVLLAGERHPSRPLRIAQDRKARVGALLRPSRRGTRFRPPRSGDTMPPTRPATIGRPFQSASETVRPNPSRIDFWMTCRRAHLEGVHLDRADVVQVREDVDVGVAWPRARRSGCRTPSPRDRRGPSIRPAPTGRRAAPRTRAGRRRSPRAGPSRGRSGKPASAAAGRRRSRTDRRCTRRPRRRAPCSSARADRSPAARCSRSEDRRRRERTADGGRWLRRSAATSSRGSRRLSRFGADRSMWQRQIQWRAASRTCSIIAHGCGSWTMTKSYSSVERLGVAPVVLLVDRALLLVEALRVSLQRVVDRLRDLEELLLAPDDPPLDVEAGVDCMSGISV